MGFLIKFIAKVVLNGVALYIATRYLSGFILTGGITTFIIGALVLTLLNVFVRPVLRIISAPLVWVTFGFFNLVINMVLLWAADKILTQLSIQDLTTLFWTSIIIALANAFF